jgi:hypothetical protein
MSPERVDGCARHSARPLAPVGTYLIDMRGLLGAILALLCVAAPAAHARVDGAEHRCASGKHAVIAAKHACLRVGALCARRHDSAYHRYGFHCHRGRLTRSTPQPPAPVILPPQPLPPIEGPPGAPGCMPPSPARILAAAGASVEIRGNSPGFEFWALAMGPLRWSSANEAVFVRDPDTNPDFKIVWRMTGTGPFSVTATGPNGAVYAPTQGPTAHGFSTWYRSGDEWGSVWHFAQDGCWHIRADRGNGHGELWMLLQRP